MTSGITTSRTIFSRDLRNAHRLELLALALALQRGKRTFTLLLVEGVVDRELYALALLVDLRLSACGCRACGLLDAAAALVFLGRPPTARPVRLGASPSGLARGGTGNVDLARLAAFARLQRRIEGGARASQPVRHLSAGAADGSRCSEPALDEPRPWQAQDAPLRREQQRRRPPAGRSWPARLPRRAPNPRAPCAAASARARASRSSVDSPRAAAAGLTFCGAAVSGRVGGFFCATSGSGVASIGGASASEPELPVLRFSTTTDFERPWLKFCRTWPDSTVRWSDSGLRTPPRRVLSVVSFVSVMLFPLKLQNSTHEAALSMRRSPTGSASSARPPEETAVWLRPV